MASPSIRGQTAPVSGGTTTSPAGTQVGDLVIVYTFERLGAAAGTTLTHNSGAGFSNIRNHFHDDSSTDGALGVAYKVATQAGAQSYQGFTTSTGSPVWWTGCTVLTVGTFDTGTIVSAGVSQTNNAVPNPPSATGLTSAREYLVLAIAAWHLGSSVTNAATAPTNYTNLVQLAGSATADLACSSRAITGATSEDPGTYGDDQAPNGTCSITVAIASPSLAQGNGAPALTLGASGAGKAIKAGLAVAACVLGLAGAGVSLHYGDSAPALSLGASGEGETPAEAPSEGTGASALTLGATGAGATTHYGNGSSSLTLGHAGEGATIYSGTGGPLCQLGAAGEGLAGYFGSGTSALSLGAQGAGATVYAGSATVGVTLGIQGGGDVAHEGSGEVALTLGVEGSSAGTSQGQGSISLTLAASGQGTAIHHGLGLAALSLGVEGEGEEPEVSQTPHGHAICGIGLAVVGFGPVTEPLPPEPTHGQTSGVSCVYSHRARVAIPTIKHG